MIDAELSTLDCIERGSHEEEITRAGAKKIIFEPRQDLAIGLCLLMEGCLPKAGLNKAAHIILVFWILRADNVNTEIT